MLHAIQGNIDNNRVNADDNINNLCSDYYGDSRFEELITLEGHYLEEAINADNQEDRIKNTKLFLKIRKERRVNCGLSEEEIREEKELEWLEGMARYAEYYASRGSSSMIAKNLLQIEDKVKTDADDRYYTLGMAQAMVLDKFDKIWKEKVLDDGYTLEECLISYTENK